MSVIVFASLHGSPGVSTLAAALAYEMNLGGRSTLLLEADPDGGVLAARFDLPLSPNLTDLAGAARRSIDVEQLSRFAQRLVDRVPVVVAHPAAEQTSGALRAAAASLSDALPLADFTVLVDAGRWRPDSPALPLVDAASLVVVVVRPLLEDVVRLVSFASTSALRERVRLVIIGERPYTAAQVTDATALPVLAVLPLVRGMGSPGQREAGGRQRRRWVRMVSRLASSLVAAPDGEMGIPAH